MKCRKFWHLPTGASAVALALLYLGTSNTEAASPPAHAVDFVHDVQPILEAHCYACHGETKQKSELRLDVKADALKGGSDGPVIVPGKGSESLLVNLVSGLDKDRVMPAKGSRLTPEQIGLLRAWIDQGAVWPDGVDKHPVTPRRHWAYEPLSRPAIPTLVNPTDTARVRNPIDAFVLAKLREKGLTPSPEADRRTLIRRVYFDITGLPPTPAEIQSFAADPDPHAYEKCVDQLLASPRYGECWARHWLDAVRYGDSHGYDKDKPRNNAWPYRDYVIRAFNEDKPYDRFVKEQLAGDWFYPDTTDGVVALGFIAAGPFDFVGQIELRDDTIDKKVTRNLDRDDMVTATMNTFVSTTAQCARCHDHKFDPVTQVDYYSLQAVFAGIDRADRPYDPDPKVASQRHDLQIQLARNLARTKEIEQNAIAAAGPELADINAKIAELSRPGSTEDRPEFGYHAEISPEQNVVKWVQVDLGRPTPLATVVLVGAHDTFGGIGAGFGFPVRYKVEACDDAAFKIDVVSIVDHTDQDFPNPGVRPQRFPVGGRAARYVRLTATRLAPRTNDYILAMGEMMVLTADGVNVAAGRPVTSLDSIEAVPRWSRKNIVDGYYYGIGKTDRNGNELAALQDRRESLLARALGDASHQELKSIELETKETQAKLDALPKQQEVYAATEEFAAAGSFTPTHGIPRPVYLLRRGSEKNPQDEVAPGTVGFINGLASRFDLPSGASEAQRRAALAEWITDPRNPLTYRSIVNRIWQYHFGRGIVESPNDFGRMGATPTHPELLEWLATDFRDGGKSIKKLNRLILTSSTYRQASSNHPSNDALDGGNQYLWRMNRHRLEAEEIHDAVLTVAGKLDLTMGGPGYRTFGFEDDHSPHYKYQEFNPDDPKTLRRSIYRFAVRSVPDPFMEALDCADPSQVVARRDETLTALQALALLNDKLMVRMAEHFAQRVDPMAPDLAGRVNAACWLALGRAPSADESKILTDLAARLGMPEACRVLFNTNEFSFID